LYQDKRIEYNSLMS